jgi:hypothetical protein
MPTGLGFGLSWKFDNLSSEVGGGGGGTDQLLIEDGVDALLLESSDIILLEG